MGSSILQRWKQVVVPTEWKSARLGCGVVWLIEKVSESPLALAVGEQDVYGTPRRFLNEYGYIRNAVVKHGPHNWKHRIRLIVQGDDYSGTRVWEWGYDCHVNSQSVPLSKYWVCGTAPTGAMAKELAEASLAEWAPLILRSGDPVYPAGQALAEWASLFENCEDLDENGHPSLDPTDHDHYRALVEHKVGGAERALEVAQGFCDVGKDGESAADYPSYLSYKQGTWADVADHYTKEIARINSGLQIIAKIISKITATLSSQRDAELKEKGIKTGDWPDVNVIEGYAYRQARLLADRDSIARIVNRNIKGDGTATDFHLRAVQLLERKQVELGRASAGYQRSRGLGIVQLAEN